MSWRPMTPGDLPRVQALADAIHVDHPEDLAVLAERQRLYPPGCLMLTDGDEALGYALSHPWFLAEPPPLNQRLGRLPDAPTTYYVHDLALLPAARGRGFAAQAADRLAAHARAAGFDNLSLVAVSGSWLFWERAGFRVRPVGPGLEAKLAGYGAEAAFMVRALADAGPAAT